LSVADYARDDVLLHVSASNERQECGNETGAITKRIPNFKLTDSMDLFSCILIEHMDCKLR
jgi:hypothetical protein